jgi:eukaryotic-like serine/threonine-protein kinase
MSNIPVDFASCAPESELFSGTNYRLLRTLAKGGMGDVYLVAERDTGSQWVAKVVHEKLAGDPQLVDRVRIEAQALSNLHHPNIVSVVDLGTTTDNRPFIVMEYLEGDDLGRELASGRMFSLEEILKYIDQALSGIAAAHSLGIIHRDLKPDNLFLQDHGDGTRTLKVLDFGVARIVPGTAPHTPSPLAYATATGVIVGTLKYVSPEGAAGLAVDYRADIYSMGLVLYRMLAGRSPYGDDIADSDLIALRLTQAPKPPSYFASCRIAPQLDEIVMKALQLSPRDRYQTAIEFAQALREVRPRALSYANLDDEVPLALRVKRDEVAAVTGQLVRRSTNLQYAALIGAALVFVILVIALAVIVG